MALRLLMHGVSLLLKEISVKACELRRIIATLRGSNQLAATRDEIVPVPVERDWSYMPLEMLEIIKSKLPLLDQIKSFSCVCKQWNHNFTFAYPADISPLILFYKQRESGDCNYYSPALNKSFAVSCPVDILGTVFRAASDGWILVSRGQFELFLINPLTGMIHKIPELSSEIYFNAMAFSPPPLHPPFNFVVFGIMHGHNEARLSYCRVGGEKPGWSAPRFFDNNNEFYYSTSNPVFHNGLFYCLDKNGTLATFDPLEAKWNILQMPRHVFHDYEIKECFLAESPSEGKLLSVFIMIVKKLVKVFRLNEVEMEWEEVNCLQGGDEALFVGNRVSFVSRVTPSMSNNVFLSRIHGYPETIRARVEEIHGQVCFVPEAGQQTIKTTTTTRATELKGVVYCPLKSEEVKDKYRYYDSREYVFNIWYQPKYHSVKGCLIS